MFSHYYHHHYRHHCFVLVCESACACVWGAHLVRKLITISLYQKLKKKESENTQTIFYNNFTVTYHDLFFWYATFFEYLHSSLLLVLGYTSYICQWTANNSKTVHTGNRETWVSIVIDRCYYIHDTKHIEMASSRYNVHLMFT